MKPRPYGLGFLFYTDLGKMPMIQNNILFLTESQWEGYALTDRHFNEDLRFDQRIFQKGISMT